MKEFPDDLEPITPQWLRSIGFKKNRPCQVWGTPNCHWWNGTLEIYDHNDTGSWLWVEHDSVEMRTRGDLRLLLAWVGLRVSVKEADDACDWKVS